jgi:hypothetical protein
MALVFTVQVNHVVRFVLGSLVPCQAPIKVGIFTVHSSFSTAPLQLMYPVRSDRIGHQFRLWRRLRPIELPTVWATHSGSPICPTGHPYYQVPYRIHGDVKSEALSGMQSSCF